MRKKNTDKLLTGFLILMFLIGAGLLSYPTVCNLWNSSRYSRAVENYTAVVSRLDEAEYERILTEAREWNDMLFREYAGMELATENLKNEYKEKLNVDGSGMMGYVEIDKINVILPIYHGTDEGTLSRGVGHLEGTSLPVGGLNTHCVISGHRGLVQAKLFTDLDMLKEGDRFVLHILDETLTYEVDRIRIVLPEETGDLAIEKGKDYCTLLTCTPYGINSHRLLVRGTRVDNDVEVRVGADAMKLEPVLIAPFFAIPVLLLLFVLFMIFTRKRKKKEDD